jgi:hypothetical protein
VNIIQVDKRFTKVQNKLFEQAHTHPCELKPLAIAMKTQGFQGERLYAHPQMMPLPMNDCYYLNSLSNKQRSIVSAMYYALNYQYIATSEMQVVTSNMYVANKVFSPYTDEYMILHQETAEEYDHIWSFHTVHGMAEKLDFRKNPTKVDFSMKKFLIVKRKVVL